LLVVREAPRVVVGGERGRLETGEMAVVPAMVPHDVFCAGDQPVKVVGWFASATVVSVFDESFAPIGKRVLGTPLPEETALDEQGVG
jgi:gentisate 1,2-dioxygenase